MTSERELLLARRSCPHRGGDHEQRDSLLDAAKNRDGADVAEEWVARALQGDRWETRDNYPYPDDEVKIWIERGTTRGGNLERLLDTPLTYAEGCVVERLLSLARGEDPDA